MSYWIAPVAGFLFLSSMFIGWCMNIIAIVHTASDPITGLFIARLVGLFAAPLGAILGWFA